MPLPGTDHQGVGPKLHRSPKLIGGEMLDSKAAHSLYRPAEPRLWKAQAGKYFNPTLSIDETGGLRSRSPPARKPKLTDEARGAYWYLITTSLPVIAALAILSLPCTRKNRAPAPADTLTLLPAASTCASDTSA